MPWVFAHACPQLALCGWSCLPSSSPLQYATYPPPSLAPLRRDQTGTGLMHPGPMSVLPAELSNASPYLSTHTKNWLSLDVPELGRHIAPPRVHCLRSLGMGWYEHTLCVPNDRRHRLSVALNGNEWEGTWI